VPQGWTPSHPVVENTGKLQESPVLGPAGPTGGIIPGAQR
jgi:hypothetical protein